MDTEIPEDKNSAFSKMFFGNEYDNLKKLIESKSKENAEECRRIFADSFLEYIDKILTPIENFGMKNHKELSFLDTFYIFLKKQNKTMLRFPFSESNYYTPTFSHIASYIIEHNIEDIFHSFLGKNSWWWFELNKESCEAIEKSFTQRGETSQNIARFIKDNPDYQFAAMNYERKSNYWCKKFLASFTILPEWIWCLVGNIVQKHEYGEEHEIRHGIKQFVGGTKVYCFPSK